MAERIVEITAGGKFENEEVPANLQKQARAIVGAFQSRGLISPEDEITVVIKPDQALQPGSVGRQVKFTQVFRDGERGPIDDCTDVYSVDING